MPPRSVPRIEETGEAEAASADTGGGVMLEAAARAEGLLAESEVESG